MSESQWKPSLVAKALTIAAIGMGVGFGTCGLTLLTSAGNGLIRPFSTFVAGAGAALFFVSLACGVITVLIFLGNLIVESFRK
jgi:hypothetical protein